jgi:rhamnopyranosyl-N-acetylglucosaminyl-diphospho-decaprenol beta-1,3/1,4-galactofuranosyltransferase
MRQHVAADQLLCLIVTHNRAEQLSNCLSHTLRQDVDHVLVIDNASSDNTQEVLAAFQARDPRLVVERQRRNRGGAWGFARGMRMADQWLGGRGWLLLFDDDSWPEADCIARFRARLPDYRRAGLAAVGSAVFAADGRAVEANRPVLNLFRRPAQVLALTSRHSRSFRDLYHVPHGLLARGGQRLAVDSISFVGLFLDLEALPQGRGRYPRGGLFIYSDDTTYTLDLGRRGRRAILDTDLVFRHDTQAGGAATPWLFPAWKHYYVVRNSFLMNRSLSGLWYVPLCLATVLTHAIKGLRLRYRNGDGTVLAMVALGVRDGLRNHYSRPHKDLEARCARTGRAERRRLSPTPGTET